MHSAQPLPPRIPPTAPGLLDNRTPLPHTAPPPHSTSSLHRTQGLLFTTHSPFPSINSASLADLIAIPGVGPSRAQALLAAQPIRSIAALDAVPGVGPVTRDAILERFNVEALNASGAARPSINDASQAQLEAVPGLSTTTALALIAARPFTSVAAVDAVRGVGPITLSRLLERYSIAEQQARECELATSPAT